MGFNFNRSDDYLPPGGFAFMIYAMAGVNLGVLDGGTDTFLDRMRVYVNGMSISMPGDRAFGGEMYNLGVHGQLKVVPQMGNKVVEWGGLDITSGWNRAQYRLELWLRNKESAPAERLKERMIACLSDGVSNSMTLDFQLKNH